MTHPLPYFFLYWSPCSREGYDGEVLLNDQKLSADDVSQRSSHVPQTDLHLDCFSVKETLWIAAELKFPTSSERRDKFKAVSALESPTKKIFRLGNSSLTKLQHSLAIMTVSSHMT